MPIVKAMIILSIKLLLDYILCYVLNNEYKSDHNDIPNDIDEKYVDHPCISL